MAKCLWYFILQRNPGGFSSSPTPPPPRNVDKSFPRSSLLPPTRVKPDSAMQTTNTGTFSYSWCCCFLRALLPHASRRGGSSRGKEGETVPGNRTTWHLGKGEITPLAWQRRDRATGGLGRGGGTRLVGRGRGNCTTMLWGVQRKEAGWGPGCWGADGERRRVPHTAWSPVEGEWLGGYMRGGSRGRGRVWGHFWGSCTVARVEKAKTSLPSAPYIHAKFSSSARTFICVVLAWKFQCNSCFSSNIQLIPQHTAVWALAYEKVTMRFNWKGSGL